jgi:N-methylhydantoinase A
MAIAAADIGGTFTDLIMVGNDGMVSVNKRLSTREDYGRAVTEGVLALLASNNQAPGTIQEIRHGTTVATNAVLERRGAKTALITTAGFRDVLEIGRLRTPKLYDITWSKPAPLVPRRLRLEVEERMAADGTPVYPLDVDQAIAIANKLAECGIESVAVCLLNAYVNDAHEQAIRAILSQHCPMIDVSLSSEVLREMREFERTSTTVADAYVKPVMRAYLQQLKGSLRAHHVDAAIYVMQSNGGVSSLDETVRRPVYAIESGPAAGIIGARRLCLSIGVRDAVTFDMGGTTAKASIIENGAIDYSPEFEIGGEVSRNSRLIKGSGYLIRTPAIDVAEVGAGGGSIAWLDAASGLKVGPLSAGASPGPACYGFGGMHPTVTDANLVLGFLNPGGLAGGSVPVDVGLAKTAIFRVVGDPLGIDVQEAAFGIHSIANANMARAIRAVSIERGRDIRKFRLVAFGGNGPIHAASLARMFDMAGVIVPPNPGVFSAVGLVFAEKEQHFVYTIPGSRLVLDTSLLQEQLPRCKAAALKEFGSPKSRRQPVFEWYADMRYVGQGHDLRIRIAENEEAESVRQRFGAEHKLQYGHAFDGAAVEIMNLRVIVREQPDSQQQPVLRQTPSSGGQGGSSRQCYFGAPFGAVEARVLASRAALHGRSLSGPLVIEEYDTTIVVPPDFVASVDAANNVHLTATPTEHGR